MPKPADITGGVRSNTEYGKARPGNHPLTLSNAQALNHANEPTAQTFQGPSSEAGTSRVVLQRTGIN